MTLEHRLYLLFVASLPIVRPVYFRLSGVMVPLSDVLFAATTAVWLVSVARGRAPIAFSRFYALLALYFVVSCLSAMVSPSPGRSAVKLAGLAYLMGVAVVTMNMVRSWQFLRAVMSAWIVGTAVTAAVGVAGVLLFYAGIRDPAVNLALGGDYGSLPPGDYPRVQGLFANPNMMCSYMSISLMVMSVMHALGWLTASIARPLFAGTWIATIFSTSPGLGGFFLSAAIWRWLREQTTRRDVLTRLFMVGGILAALGFAIVLVVFPQPAGGQGSFDVPVIGRVVWGPRPFVWRTAYDTFRAHPLLGRGLGTAVAEYRWVAPSGRPQHLTDAHNIWLSIAGQLGLAGLAAFGLVTAYICRSVWPLATDPTTIAVVKKGLGIGFAAVVFYQGLSGSFEEARHLWALMGLIVCVSEVLPRKTDGTGAVVLYRAVAPG